MARAIPRDDLDRVAAKMNVGQFDRIDELLDGMILDLEKGGE
jgi:hypothetical protein